ncbi:MAG: DUF4291 domain-containing protein [Clostridiales bacterium]|nr:DUF4291 domain-containing protein [Clostridiales bacterium]
MEAENRIFAAFDERTIRVYQAYSDAIADEAIKLGTFGDSFKLSRMTWIKQSFLWMIPRKPTACANTGNRSTPYTELTLAINLHSLSN